MAFATANVSKSYFGNLNVTYGDWTGSAGDANGTLTVEGGRIYLMDFSIQDNTTASTPGQYVDCFVSTTGTGNITVSVPNRQTVATGRFIVISA